MSSYPVLSRDDVLLIRIGCESECSGEEPDEYDTCVEDCIYDEVRDRCDELCSSEGFGDECIEYCIDDALSKA